MLMAIAHRRHSALDRFSDHETGHAPHGKQIGCPLSILLQACATQVASIRDKTGVRLLHTLGLRSCQRQYQDTRPCIPAIVACGEPQLLIR